MDSECDRDQMMRAIILILAVASFTASGEIIPTDKRYTWQTNSGVSGGIPDITTMFANVKNAPYNAVGDGVANDWVAIQTALNACPSNQYVYIPASQYRLTNVLKITNYGSAFRGDGTNSWLKWTNNVGKALIQFGNDIDSQYTWFPSNPNETTVTAGYDKGSSTITVSSTTGFIVNQYFMIDCLTNFYMNPWGNEGLGDFNGRPESQAQRCTKQICQITGISGSDVSFTPPLAMTFSNSLSPKALPFNANIKRAGIENMKLSTMNDTANPDSNFRMFGAMECWIKNVESDYADGDHVNAASSFRVEIRDSYFHDGFSHGPGTEDDCIKIHKASSFFLVENNIFRRMHCAVMFWGGGMGHVLGYNFVTNTFDTGSPTVLYPEFDFHGAHIGMVLIEGNVLNQINQDGTWGTGSHGTILRTTITGLNYGNGPTTGRGVEDSSWTKQIAGAWAINLAGYGVSSYFNIVGNAIGTPTMGNYPSWNPIYLQKAGDTRSWDHGGVCLTLGFRGTQDTSPQDSLVPYNTLLNHGNWDVVSGTVSWDAGIADHVIPDSYYQGSKPSFFGALPWPFNPTNSVTNLPAVDRWLNWTNGPSFSGGGGGGGTSHGPKRATQQAVGGRRR